MNKPSFLCAAMLAAALVGCGGGGVTSLPQAPKVLPSPSIAPSKSPVPSPSPSPSPSASPSSAPVTSQKRQVKAAPLSAPPTTQSRARRPLSTVNGLPLLVESSGTAAEWAGDFVSWVTDDNGNDVVETSATTNATNGLLIDDPAIEPLNCGTSTSGWCGTHPLAWTFGPDSGLTKPIGQQTITVTFGDGATANFTDDVYNGWQLSCGQSIAYVSGIPTITTGAADITYDCANSAVDFPFGVVEAAPPTQDAYGLYATVIATVTSPIAVPVGSPTSIAWSNFTPNAVYVYGTADGGTAKIYATAVGGLSITNTPGPMYGLTLHANADGSYAY